VFYKNLLTHIFLPVIAVFMLVFTVYSISKNRTPPKREITSPPPISKFQHKIAAIGVVEPETKTINITTDLSGILKEVYVTEGEPIKKGDKLFTIDDRDAKAQLKKAEAELGTASVNYQDLKNTLELLEKLKDKRAISNNELLRKQFAAEKAKMQLDEARAHVEMIKTNLDRLTIYSPIDGYVLKVLGRIGEYITPSSSNPSMVIGDLDDINVRVSVDEADIKRLDQNAQAVGMLRGSATKEIELKFLRYEPYVIPKLNLSNNVIEKIDTRVLEVIYKFDNSKVGAIPGQQMDIFIEEIK